MKESIYSAAIGIIEWLPINLISYIFTSGIIISLATHYFYKSNAKWKHKKLIILDDVRKFLLNIGIGTLFAPLIYFLFIWVMLLLKIDVFIHVAILIIILGTYIIFTYIKITRKKYGISTLAGKKEKFKRLFFRYILVVTVMGISIIINTLLASAFQMAITGFSQLGLETVEFIFVCIAFYIFSPYIIFAIRIFHEEGLEKKIKSVGIFYNQNGKTKVDLNIKFENFDIDKNYISFYCDVNKTKRVIQTKDLIRIEYCYKN